MNISVPGGVDPDEAARQIRSGEMPMAEYLWLHPEAQLTGEEKEQLIEDRKDKRIKMEGTQQSQMIDQRKSDLPPIDFEQKDMASIMPSP